MSCSQGSSSEHCQDERVESLYFEILSSDNFGRYLVAKEDIDEKTLILCEKPVVFGPTDDKNLRTNVVTVYCLSCCRQLYPPPVENASSVKNDSLEDVYHCSQCGFPVCDKLCENVSNLWGNMIQNFGKAFLLFVLRFILNAMCLFAICTVTYPFRK